IRGMLPQRHQGCAWHFLTSSVSEGTPAREVRSLTLAVRKRPVPTCTGPLSHVADRALARSANHVAPSIRPRWHTRPTYWPRRHRLGRRSLEPDPSQPSRSRYVTPYHRSPALATTVPPRMGRGLDRLPVERSQTLVLTPG